MMTDEQVTEFCNSVARETWRSMNDAVAQDRKANPDESGDECAENCETSLYVYADGNWTIEGAQYLTDHRNIVAAVSITLVNGPAELADLIEAEFDDTDDQASDVA